MDRLSTYFGRPCESELERSCPRHRKLPTRIKLMTLDRMASLHDNAQLHMRPTRGLPAVFHSESLNESAAAEIVHEMGIVRESLNGDSELLRDDDSNFLGDLSFSQPHALSIIPI